MILKQYVIYYEIKFININFTTKLYVIIESSFKYFLTYIKIYKLIYILINS